MTANRKTQSMSISMPYDWLNLFMQLSNVLLPGGFILKAHNLQVNSTESSLFAVANFTKANTHNKYVDYICIRNDIDSTAGIALRLVNLEPETVLILFLLRPIMSPEEYSNPAASSGYNPFDDSNVYCTFNMLIDENVIVVTATEEYCKRIALLLKKYQ